MYKILVKHRWPNGHKTYSELLDKVGKPVVFDDLAQAHALVDALTDADKRHGTGYVYVIMPADQK